MKPTTFALTTLLLSPLALATTCNQQTATDVSCIEDDSCGDSGSSTDSSDDYYSLTERAIIPHLTPRAASFSARSVTRFLLSRRSAVSGRLNKRQDDSIECTGSEQCFSDSDLLICLDLDSGDFSDNYGDTGNVNTGAVTDSDGEATTISDFAFGASTAGGLGGFGGAGSTDMGGLTMTTTSEGGLGGSGGLTVPTTTPTRSGLNVQSGSQSTGGAVTSTAGAKTGGTASVSSGSSSGQPTGHVAGGGAGGKASVDVAAAMGVVGLMAAMI